LLVENMRICPDCHVVLQETASFCDNCGYPLGSGLPESVAVAPATELTLVGKATAGGCSSCGYQNVPGEMFCQNCGVQLAPVTSAPPPLPMPISHVGGSSGVESPKLDIHLVSRSNQALIALDMDRDEWLVGRSDPVRGIFPEVDLGALGGDESGVSRRHARLAVLEDRRFISDLNSTNFTFLNGEKLQPGRLYPLKHGDEIRFGLLAMIYCEGIAQ
jgi:hypothetical protein